MKDKAGKYTQYLKAWTPADREKLLCGNWEEVKHEVQEKAAEKAVKKETGAAN